MSTNLMACFKMSPATATTILPWVNVQKLHIRGMAGLERSAEGKLVVLGLCLSNEVAQPQKYVLSRTMHVMKTPTRQKIHTALRDFINQCYLTRPDNLITL